MKTTIRNSKTTKVFSAFTLFFLLSLFSIMAVEAATYCIAPTGSDSNPGTQAQPFATFKYAFTRMAGGDTLIVVDGTYNQVMGEWEWRNSVKVPTSQPPSGGPGNYTTVKAQNVRAIINKIEIIGSSYIKLEGFKTLNGLAIDGSNHIEARRIAAKGGAGTARSSYITKEDVWAWDDNRYVIHNYKSDHVIDHRVIARLDDVSGVVSGPVGAISHYLTDYSVIAHALLFDVSDDFDSRWAYDLVYSSRPSDGSDQIVGLIGFNPGNLLGGIYPGDGNGADYEIRNSIIWGTTKRCIRFNSSGPLKVLNSTCGENGGTSIYSSQGPVEVRNNIFYSNSGATGSVTTCDNNLVYNSGTLPGSCTNTSTINPGIRYLPRSPIPGKGASIEKRYSISEVNGKFVVTETAQNLWPWPYENLIKQDMCEGTTKGWCSTNKTLTQYVWEYLGNPCPQEICGAQPPDIQAPTTPANLQAQAISSTRIDLSWNASTDDMGVAGYKIFRDAVQIATTAGLTYSDTGLTPATTYSYQISAYDAAGNESAKSTAVSATTLASGGDIVPPQVSITSPANGASVSGTITISATATDNIGVVGVQFLLDGANLQAEDTISPYDISLDTITIANGAHNLTAVARDAAGNSATSVAVNITVDNPISSDCSAANILCVDDTVGATQEYSTIQAAAAAANPGDTVFVYDGNYAGFQVSTSGTLSSPIVFKAKGAGAIINTGGPTGDGARLSNASYITIEGFKIQNVSERCIAARDGSPAAPMKGVTIRNNTCTSAGREGFYLSQVANSLLEGNTITGSGATGVTPKAHGIYLANAGSDNTIIRGNIILDAKGTEAEGIHMNGDLSIGGDGLISGVTIENNIIARSGNSGLSMDGVQDSLVQNNLIYGSRKHGLRAYKIDGAAGPKNLKVVNNTFLVPSTGGWAMKLSQDLGGHTFFNNILLSDASGSICVANTNFASNNNALVNKLSLDNEISIITLSNWQSSGHDVNSFLSEKTALFVNPAGNDYKLKDGVPAINAGVNSLNSVLAPTIDILGNGRPQGAAYDLGAYESVGITPPPDTEPPVVSITSPVNGVTVSGTISIQATATDNIGVVGVQFKLDGANLQAEDTVSPYAISLDTAAIANGTHNLTAAARDAAGNSATSTAVSITVNNDLTAPVISNVAASSTNTAATITWNTDESSTSQVAYGITLAYGNMSPLDSSLVTNHSVSLTGLTSETLYHYRVKSKDMAGNEAISADFTFTTMPASDITPPAQPQGLQATAISSTRIDLSWSASTDNIGVAGYKIFRDATQIATTAGLAYSDTGLQPSTTYTYTVSAYDAAGNESSQSTQANATTLATSLTSGLIGHYKFDEGTGTATSDSSGNGNTGTLVNGPVWTTGKIGGALSFDGVNDYVNIANNPSLNLTGDFTLASWVKFDSLPLTGSAKCPRIIQKGNSAATDVYALNVNTGCGNGEAGVSFKNNGVRYSVSGTQVIAINQWYHFVGVRNGTTLKIYVNGIEEKSVVVTANSIDVNAQALILGESPGNTDGAVDGLLDELRIYNRALSVSEITELYNLGSEIDTTPPTTPADLRATAISSTRIDLSWSAATDNVGVTGYKVFRDAAQIATTTGLAYSDTGLQPSTTYTYTISAYDAAGNESSQSAQAQATTLLPPDTEPPVVSITSPVNGATVSGTISIQATATDNIGVVGVQFKLDGANLQAEDTTSPYSISVDTKTIANGTHNLTAAARDAAGNSAASTAVSITVNNDLTAPVISNVAASSTNTAATITWTTDESSTSQVAYGITLAYGNMSPLDSSLVTNHSVSLTGLTPETLYHYRVKSKDMAGNEAISADFTFTTMPASDITPPAQPQGLRTTSVTDTSIGLSWTANTEVDLSNYKLYRNGLLLVTILKPNTSYSDIGLTPSTTYTYELTAVDAAGNESGRSIALVVSTLPPSDVDAPTVPTNLKAQAISSTRIDLSWSASTDNIGVAGYKIFRDATQIATTAGLTYSDTGLTPATTYSYQISAYDASGNESAKSIAASAKTMAGVGTTYYLSPTGSDTNSGTEAQPFATFSKAFLVMAGGDTLIVKDGLYNQRLIDPPSGTASQYTIVRAENDGGVLLENSSDSVINLGTSYVQVEGFDARTTSSGGSIVRIEGGHHVKLLRCSAFRKGGISSYPSGISINADYVLVEDCAVAGGARYVFAVGNSSGNSNNVIVRRCVIRWDYDSTGSPPARGGFMVYGPKTGTGTVSNISFQNVLVLDNNDASGFSTDGAYENLDVYGSIALHIKGEGFAGSQGKGVPRKYSQNVAWDTSGYGFKINGLVGNIDQATVGATQGIYSWNGGSITNSLLVNNSGTFDVHPSYDYNWFYNNAAAPRGTNYITTNPNLKYITRTTDAGTGQGGKKRGATIEKRYGVSGTLRGEPGWNTLTNENLWPWPYEERWKKIICQENPAPTNAFPATNNWNRGFCLAGSLTQYVWEYLGSPCPSDICGVQPPDTEPPIVSIASPANGATVTGVIAIQAVATDNRGVAGVQFLLDGANLQVEDRSSPYSISMDTTTIPNGTHTISAKARDSSGNTATALTITVTVLNGVVNPPPVISGVASSSITQSQATIIWTTDEPADSQVEYGTTISYGSLAPLDTNLVTAHSLQLAGLAADTTYHYRVISKDGQGAKTTSGDFSFTTLSNISPSCSAANILCVDDTAGATQEYSTIQAAATAAKPGDTVLVYDGSYAPFHITNSGTSLSRIVFKANGTGVNISGYETYDSRYAAVHILGSYVTVEGFNVDVKAKDNLVKSRGIRVSGTPTASREGVVIKNNKVQNAGWVGITTSFANGVEILGNEVWNSKGQHGIYVGNSGDNPIVRGNISHDNQEAGIQLNADLFAGGDGIISNALIENNILYNNNIDGIGGAIECDGLTYSTIRNNLLYNNHTSGITQYKGDGAEASHHNKIYHNTIIMPATSLKHGISLRNGSTNTEIKNNIILNLGTKDSLAVDSASITGLVSDYNILTRIEDTAGALIALSQWQANYSQDIHSFVEVPANLFENPSVNDYRLKAISRAIGRGVSLPSVTTDIVGITRPQGAGYDIGAYESTETSPPLDTQAPTIPADLKAQTISSTQIDLSWSASIDNVEVVGYKIYRDGSLLSTINYPLSTYSDTGLQPSITYSYTVSAFDAAGNESEKSANVSAMTLPSPDITPPDVSVSISPINGFMATVSADATDPIVAGEITSGVAGVQFKLSGSSLGAEDTASPYSVNLDTKAIPNGMYSLTAVARDYAGNSVTSAAVSIIIDNDTTAPVISSIVSLGITPNSATITFTTDEPATSQVEYGVSLFYGSLTSLDTNLVTSHQSPVFGLTPETLYHYRVKAKDAAGNEAISSDFTFTTKPVPDITPPAVPQGLKTTSVTDTSIGLSWTANTEPDLSNYKLYRNGSLLVTILKPNTSYSDAGLTPSATYTYELAAVDAAGNESGKSAPVVVSTLPVKDTKAPTIPTNVRAVAVSSSQINLSWKASTDNVGVAGYKIYRNRVFAVNVPSLNTTYSDTNLKPATAYIYSVSSFDAAGNESAKSLSVVVWTFAVKDITPPSTPIVIDGGSFTSDRNNLSASWSAKDAESGIIEYRYRITRDAPTDGVIIRAWKSAGKNTSVTVKWVNLQWGKTYYFSVMAKNGVGLWSQVGHSDGITARQ